MNIIWNEEEKNKINSFLKNWDLQIDENNNIINNKNDESEKYTNKSAKIINLDEELINLVYYQDKKEIENILTRTIPIKYTVKRNPDNPLIFGLLTNISKINPNDCTEIFTIFYEIYSQYIRISTKITEHIITKCKSNPALIKKEIQTLKNSATETDEEKYIKNYVSKIFSYTNGITDKEIFKTLTEKCNINIRKRLLNDLEKKLTFILKAQEKSANYINKTLKKIK